MHAINWMLILVLLVVSAAMMVAGMVRKGGIYEYPFLAGGIIFSFILPQLPGLADDPYLPDTAFAKTIVVTLSCAAMTWLGWFVGKRPMRHFAWDMDDRRLVIGAALLSATGAFFFFQLSRLPEEIRSVTQQTGLPVAYLFFAKLLGYGLAMAMICFVRNGSRIALAIVVFCTLFYMDRIVIAGRRSETVDFVMIFLLALWFGRCKAFPRALGLAGMLAGALVIASTGDYRRISMDREGPSIERIKQIDVVGNLERLVDKGGDEMRNAVYKIHAIDQNMILDFGAFHWNTLVFNYIPAQIVGAEFKQLFFLPIEDPYAFTGHMPHTGTTETGMADAFGSFWYLGAFKFFLIALLMKRCYRSAMLGFIPAQLFYMLLLSSSLLSFTHHTQVIVSAWVHMAIFLFPVLLWARRPVRREAHADYDHPLASGY